MFGFFGSTSARKVEYLDDAVKRALPASWYYSGPLYDLERRAIFSRKWLLVTHSLRFAEAGHYVAFREAGFDFFLVKDRDGKINGFHNICRHRAYPIVTEESGKAAVLSCKYHGWSYGFKGNLAKAPKFDAIAGFDKSQHSLFSIHVHVDKLGFVYVNMDANEKPEFSWETDFEGVDTQERLEVFNLERDYRYDHQWHMVGDYNWKTLADNYNECYHCATGHPAVANVIDLQSYNIEAKKSYIIHYGPTKDPEEGTYRVASQFCLPNASFTITSHFFFMQRAVPISATQCRMEYEVYRKNDASDEEFKAIDEFFKTIMKEDKVLCNGAQRNLNGGIFTNGQLHPEKEEGPIWFQEQVRDILIKYREREEKENDGKPIWPATRSPVSTDKLAVEEQFCAALEGAQCPGVLAAEQGILAW